MLVSALKFKVGAVCDNSARAEMYGEAGDCHSYLDF